MKRMLPFGMVAALALAGCGDGAADGNGTGNAPAGAEEAAEGVSDKTIAAGINQDSRFFQAAKAAGLDATLAGPGPYTVLVPSDEAFAMLPADTTQNLGRPEARAEVTTLLTYHILPGTVLAADIGKAIDNAKGKAVLATMGGGTLEAVREGDRIILTDAAGNKAAVTRADEKFSNGVVHHIDAVLMPAEGEAAAPQGS